MHAVVRSSSSVSTAAVAASEQTEHGDGRRHLDCAGEDLSTDTHALPRTTVSTEVTEKQRRRQLASLKPWSNVLKVVAILPLTKDGGIQQDPMYGDAQSKLTTFMMAINDAKALYAKQNITIKYTVLDSQGHYGLAARAVQTAATNAFPGHVNGESAHVVLGSDDSVKAITDSVSASVVDYNLVNVAWGTDDAAFSHGSVYPNSERVYPSMSYESAALADFLHYQYRVSRVVLIHTINTYGQDAVDVFHWRASNYGIQVIATIGLAPGGLATNATRAQLVSDVEAIEKLDARIFVLLSDEVPAVQTFWRTAAYLLSQTTFFLGSSGCAQPALWENMHDIGWATMNVILGGFIGIQHATDDWKISPIGGAFVSRFNAMKPTVRYSRTTGQVTWCDPSVDDAGRMIYNRTLATGGTVCLGNKPSAYTVYNVSSYAGYLYDAVMLAVQGVVYYQQTQQPAGTQLKFPAYMDGSAVAASYALQNVTFQGLTGHVRIEPGIGGIPDYGWGDRVTGTRYKVVNYQINATQGFAGFKFSRVGTWTHHDMFVPCTSDPLYLANPTIYGNCTPISWATPFNVIPPDRADPVVQYMPQSIRGYLTFIVIASWLATAAVVAVLLFYGFVRKSRLLKASQPIMMLLMMMSMLWGCIRVSLATATLPTQPVCVTRFWFGHLAFTIVPTLLAKTLRVHLVVNAKMRKVKIKTSAVVAFTSALIAVMVVLMVLLTPLNKEDVYFDDYTAVTGQVTHKYFCESRDFKVDFILYAYEMLLLVVCLKVSRAVHDAQCLPAIKSFISAPPFPRICLVVLRHS